MTDTILKLVEILLLNRLLSGDNAVVIGMAARGLPERTRRQAIIAGGAGAVGLRVIFTFIVSALLGIPLIHLVGGVLLLWIAWNLPRPDDHAREGGPVAGSWWRAVWTILLADAVMSLDNVVAITAAAEGDFLLLLAGLAMSIPIVMFGSEILARLLTRYPVLVHAGVLILILTAVEIGAEEGWIHDWHALTTWETLALTLLVAVVVFGANWLLGRRRPPTPTAAGT